MTVDAVEPSRTRRDAVTWAFLYVLVLYAIPSRLVIASFGSAGAPSMLLGIVCSGGWALFHLSRATRQTELDAPRPVRRALVGFLVAVGVSYVVAMTRPIDSDEVSPADVALLSVVSWSGALLVANDGITSTRRARVLVGRFAWTGCFMALLGLAQFLTNDPLVDRISIPGLREAQFEVFDRGGFVRPSGTATHPIEFGIILAMVMPFALHSAFHGEHRNRLTRWLPVLTIGAALALTFSRSAYISIASAGLILFVGWPAQRRRSVAAGFVAMLVVLFAAVPRLFGTIGSLFRNVGVDPSVGSRTGSYTIAGEFLARAPAFGRGLGTFLPKYRIFDNEYLVLLVSIGVVGTAAFVLLAVAGIRVAVQVFRRHPDVAVADLGLTTAASIAAGSVSLAMFDGFAFPMTMGTYFLVLGIAGALYRLTPSVALRRQMASAPVPAGPGG